MDASPYFLFKRFFVEVLVQPIAAKLVYDAVEMVLGHLADYFGEWPVVVWEHLAVNYHNHHA